MLYFYNFLQCIGLIVVGPFLFVKIILTPKYRGRISKRLGFGLNSLEQIRTFGSPRIWIHALSVGEVLSSQSLVKGLREAFPNGTLLFSASTKSGEELAVKSLTAEINFFVPFPLDIMWSVRKIARLLDPHLFILVETDFWPNMLHEMKRKKVPCLLVNGRISEKSFGKYQKYRFFFRPLFQTFRNISMQTKADAAKMVTLGVPAEKIITLGNMKYESLLPPKRGEHVLPDRKDFGIPRQANLLIVGSSHPGEEEIVYRVFKRLQQAFPGIFLVIAPRKVERGKDLASLAGEHGLQARRRSIPGQDAAPVLILDTLGELANLYAVCDVAFVGGSLVAAGGHNPLEPAVFGKPVLFGPYMDDFEEISRDLRQCGAGETVSSEEELFTSLDKLFGDISLRQERGRKAMEMMKENQGVTLRHVELIADVLQSEGADV